MMVVNCCDESDIYLLEEEAKNAAIEMKFISEAIDNVIAETANIEHDIEYMIGESGRLENGIKKIVEATKKIVAAIWRFLKKIVSMPYKLAKKIFSKEEKGSKKEAQNSHTKTEHKYDYFSSIDENSETMQRLDKVYMASPSLVDHIQETINESIVKYPKNKISDKLREKGLLITDIDGFGSYLKMVEKFTSNKEIYSVAGLDSFFFINVLKEHGMMPCDIDISPFRKTMGIMQVIKYTPLEDTMRVYTKKSLDKMKNHVESYLKNYIDDFESFCNNLKKSFDILSNMNKTQMDDGSLGKSTMSVKEFLEGEHKISVDFDCDDVLHGFSEVIDVDSLEKGYVWENYSAYTEDFEVGEKEFVRFQSIVKKVLDLDWNKLIEDVSNNEEDTYAVAKIMKYASNVAKLLEKIANKFIYIFVRSFVGYDIHVENIARFCQYAIYHNGNNLAAWYKEHEKDEKKK